MIANEKVVARFILQVLPLALAVFFSSHVAGPFSTPKTAFFVLATTTLTVYALLASLRLDVPASQRLLILASMLFVTVAVVSGVASPFRYLAPQNLVFTVCGFLLFLGARWALSGLRSEQAINRLLASVSLSAALVAVIAVTQFFGADPLSSFEIAPQSGRMRMYATLGNPNFVAAFLASAFPATLCLIRLSTRLRAVWISASVLIGLAVVFTGSRAGLLGLLVGLTLFAVLEVRKHAALLSVASLLLLTSLGTHLNQRSISDSFRGRVFIWQVALADDTAISPLGRGPGTFAYLYQEKLGCFFGTSPRESLLRFAGPERHAQNDFVEAWHDTGWIGLASLLGLISAWFWSVVRTRTTIVQLESVPRSDLLTPWRVQTCTVSSAAMAGVSALCTVALFDFPLHRPETWALLWMWMALPLSSPKDAQCASSRFHIFRQAGAVSIALVGIVLAMIPLMSSYHIAQGESAEKHGQLQESIREYRAALRGDPSSPDANFDLTRALAKGGDYSGAITQSRLASRYVNEPELYILRSRILQNAGYVNEALGELKTAEKLFPYSLELRSEVASFATQNAVSD